ncbi:SpaA isopeptide-forming pilin-related protein, partial [uncultured Acetatifactor sp.]|uniref:SpaA isopeptide-forming pilin-related protein n=1 Tax=uncultured Acetatifactor sp. TaxID=1671927 RepID=UPI00272D5EA7
LKATDDTLLASVKTAVAGVDTTDLDAVAKAAETVAKAIEKFASTSGGNDSAGEIDAFASVVANHLATKAVDFKEKADSDGKAYTATVQGDGYYFIKDTTKNLDGENGSDSLSKYLLSVVKNTTIVAKDIGLVPDKSILVAQGQGEQFIKVKAGTAAIGDEVTFVVDKIKVPNTKRYEDHFVFVMNDQLPEGMTFMEIKSIKIGETTLTKDTNYTVTAKTGEGNYGPYTKPETAAAAVTAEGGQAIKVVFNDFKNYVESNNLIGEEIVITYTAVVNDDAVYGDTGNENEVTFDFSNDPNHDYDGDEFGENDPKGTTPESKTITFVTALQIFKYTNTGADGSQTKTPLAGAEFEIFGTAYNIALTTGQKYVLSSETVVESDTVKVEKDSNGQAIPYWELKDGSFTKTNPNTVGMNTTQYVNPEVTYKLVSFTEEVRTPEEAKITVVSNKEGIINVSGLKPGEYTVKETKAPDGYNKIDTEFKLVIDWDRTAALDNTNGSGGFSIGSDSTGEWRMTGDGALFQIEILNQSGSLLPSTGGIGTTIFYVVGGILVIGAGILLVAKKRMSNR